MISNSSGKINSALGFAATDEQSSRIRSYMKEDGGHRQLINMYKIFCSFQFIEKKKCTRTYDMISYNL